MKCLIPKKVKYNLSSKKNSKSKNKKTKKAKGKFSNNSNNSNSPMKSISLSNNTITLGYKGQRDLLDDYEFIRINPLTSNPKRGKTGPHYFKTIIAGAFDTCSGNDLNSKQVKEFREELVREFPNAVSPIKSYNGVDQGEEGACSFVGFLNLTILSGNKNLFRSTKIHNTWNNLWSTFDIDSASDIGQVLDKIIESKLFKNSVNIHQLITYIPIRSENNREMSFNKSFYKKDTELDEIIEKYLGDQSDKTEIYNQVPWIYQNAHLIESLIDSGKPVTINALEHTRTCIGYNEDELLFADNWTKNYEQISQNGTDDHFRAGFSTINKWAIYSWMRDIVFYS